MKSWVAAIGLLAAAPLIGQTPAATPANSVDPERLKAAQALIDQIFPPATREEMVRAMMAPMLANIRQAMTQNTQFTKAISNDPRVKILFDDFMDRQITRSAETMRIGLPGMTTAMARAYARRFDAQQLHDLSVFFATPTGRLYTKTAMTIMSDPDIAVWQRDMVTQSMSHVQEDAIDFGKKVAALQNEAQKP